MSGTTDDPSNLEYLGVTDAEMVIRLRLPTNLHQRNFANQDGSVYQETILSKDQALRLHEYLYRALFGGESPSSLLPISEDEREEVIEVIDEIFQHGSVVRGSRGVAVMGALEHNKWTVVRAS